MEILSQLFVCPNNELLILQHFFILYFFLKGEAKSGYCVIVAFNFLIFQKLKRKFLAVAFYCYRVLLVVISGFSVPCVLSCLPQQDVLGESECQFYLQVFRRKAF